ncbi:MAG: DUF177 domain-containing protein [Pseudonocardiaceae bacterium]|nr:DUF177 domain-containing protein [Pseudonocardiaceae bacterium]
MPDNAALTRPDPSSHWVIDTRELGRRAGAMRNYHRDVPSPSDLGLDVIGVPADRDVTLDVRLESVVEGVLVTGTASATVTGECSRCLDPVADVLEVPVSELFAYPDSATDDTTDPDEVSRVVDELIDLEPVVRDAVLLALPQAPLCREDCPGLCAQCGGKRADLGPDHRHETIDPRWAVLEQRFGGSERENE